VVDRHRNCLQVRQRFASWAEQTYRLNDGAKHVEVTWTVGPIPVDDGKGKEVVTHLISGINSDGVFYTDSNGREFEKRR